MASRYLGPSIDIHGGGADLIFPHHECEVAQSENAFGVEPFARVLGSRRHGRVQRRKDEQIAGQSRACCRCALRELLR